MKLSASALRPRITLLTRHAALLAFVIGLCFDGWLAWQGWQQWTESPLPPDRVTAKQLRVNEAQRQTFINNSTSYQQPIAVPTLPPVTFQGGSGG